MITGEIKISQRARQEGLVRKCLISARGDAPQAVKGIKLLGEAIAIQ